MAPVRLLIVDDNIRYRWAVLEALIVDASIEIVEEASDGHEALKKARTLKPDVVLMDLLMPKANGLEATSWIHNEMPEIRILIMTISDHEPYLHAVVEAGAAGHLLKQDTPELFAHAIQYVAEGGAIFSRSVAAKLRQELQGRQVSTERMAEALSTELVAQAEPTLDRGIPEEEIPEKDSSQSPRDAIELANVTPTMDLDTRLEFAEVVISSPVPPSVLLRLHYLLAEIPTIIIESITPSASGDTLLSISFNTPFPLLRKLSEIPFVAAVHAEPYGGRRRTALPEESARIRVVLKAD